MRIACPYCGERSNDEFSILGDADVLMTRPADATAALKNSLYGFCNSAAAVSDAAGLAKSRVSRQTAITQSAPSAAEGRRSANSDGPSSVVVRSRPTADAFTGLNDVVCKVDVMLGSAAMSVRDCLALRRDAIIRLTNVAGGDMQVVVNGVVVIGMSERSSRQAI